MKNTSIIIGGTSGIGLATAIYLNERGYDVIIGGRTNPQVAHEIAYRFIDVSEEKSIADFFSVTNTQINSIVYCAGITIKKRTIEHFNINDYLKIHQINLLGAVLTLKYAFPHLKNSKGKVVMVNTVASRAFSQFSGLEYTITKSALSGLVKQLAIDWAKDGILINTVFPSMVKTPMLQENVDQIVLDQITENIPLGRLANADEIAAVIEFLISCKNTYTTGAGFDVNGGQYLTG